MFEEGELVQSGTVRNFRTVQTEGNREVERLIDFYSLGMIITQPQKIEYML